MLVEAGEWQGRPWGRMRAVDALVSRGPAPGLSRMEPASTGVTFTNRLSLERQTTNQIYLNGSGLALGDIDGDGRPDLFMAGLDGGSILYRNLGGWRFQDVTVASGSPASGLDATGAAFVDVEGDGDLDLIVNSVGGGTVVHLNDGKGRFIKSALLNPGKGGMSLALADYDGDGFLDLYVANYRTVTLRDQPQTQFRVVPVNGVPTITAVNGRPTTEPDLEGL